jgi:hypothetical protein
LPSFPLFFEGSSTLSLFVDLVGLSALNSSSSLSSELSSKPFTSFNASSTPSPYFLVDFVFFAFPANISLGNLVPSLSFFCLQLESKQIDKKCLLK